MQPPTLLEIQRGMRTSLLEHRDQALRPHVVEDGFTPGERLDIYRNTLASTLTRALHLSFPAVRRLVGNDFFASAASIFVASAPPASACLDDYGASFPAFLAAFEPARSLAYLPDVARLEWAVSRALHAHDADTEGLMQRLPANLAETALVPHPSVSLIRSDHPVDTIWLAVLEEDDAALRAVDPRYEPVCLLVERVDAGINVQRMSEDAWQFTAALCDGKPLHAAFPDYADFDAAALLGDHLAKGRFVGWAQS